MIEKIVFVIPALNRGGGAERVISYLANYLVSLGTFVTVVTLNSSESSYELDERVAFHVTEITGKRKCTRQFRRIHRLRKHFKQAKPDVVISFLTRMNIQTLISLVGMKIPLIVSERNDPSSENSIVEKILIRLLYSRCNGCVLQTEDAQKWFPKSVQKASIVIPNPVRKYASKRLPEKTNKVVTVGRLVPQKNHKLLIDAFARFVEQYTDAQLVIYGEGSMQNELFKYTLEKGVVENVVFAGFHHDVISQIADASFFVLSSDYEGMPNALMEAMSLGLPCISTDCPCGGPRYLIRSGENGLLVPVKDVLAMKNAMERLAGDKPLREKLGSRAKSISQDLSVESIANQWVEYIKQTIERFNRTHGITS